MSDMPLRIGHYRVLATASLGQLLGGGLATLVGIIIPLMEIGRRPELTSFEQGLTGCVSLTGIMVGATFFGPLTDRYGYLRFYRICPALVLVGALLGIFASPSWGVLIGYLFVMGFGIGGEYSLDSEYISGIMPDRFKLPMVGAAKAASAVGNVVVALLCFLIIKDWSDAEAWRSLLWIIAGIAALMLLLRIFALQSPAWLAARGRRAEAQAVVSKLLGADVVMDIPEPEAALKPADSMFRGKNLLRVIFCGIPWACEGLGVYGIGVFLPMLCRALGLEHAANPDSALSELTAVASSVKVTVLINCFIIPGFVVGLLVMRRYWHVAMQTVGFLAAALGLVLLLFAYEGEWNAWWSILGFFIFEFFLNVGPHLLTFIMPSQIYPVADRGRGSGLAASFGKAGAVAGVFFIPVLLHWGGARLVLLVSALVMLVGALFTYVFGRLVLPRK
jgi:MFS family permease